MTDWPLNDSQLLTAGILGVMLVVLIVTAFRKATVTRKEFARLREDIKQLSEEVKEPKNEQPEKNGAGQKP